MLTLSQSLDGSNLMRVQLLDTARRLERIFDVIRKWDVKRG
jgi:hypothetical protein